MIPLLDCCFVSVILNISLWIRLCCEDFGVVHRVDSSWWRGSMNGALGGPSAELPFAWAC